MMPAAFAQEILSSLWTTLIFLLGLLLMVRLIGLTGPIACGKSAVTERLRAAGCPVIDADQITHELYLDSNSSFHTRVLAAVGSSVLGPDGRIDRKKVGEIVFNDRAKLTALNKATHMLILKEIIKQTLSLMVAGNRQVALDVPLLIKFPILRRLCLSTFVVVVAPPEVQLCRLMARNGLSKEEAQKKIDAQLSVEALRSAADQVVENGSGLEELDVCVADFLLRQPQGWTALEVGLAGVAVMLAVGCSVGAAFKAGLSWSVRVSVGAATAAALLGPMVCGHWQTNVDTSASLLT